MKLLNFKSSAFLATLAIASLTPLSLMANIKNAPKNFSIPEGVAVFVDFQSVEYNLSYDSSAKKADVTSVIHFETTSEGFPVFDLVDEPTQVLVDGEVVTSKTVKAGDDKVTMVRVALKALKPGAHTLLVRSTLSRGVKFSADGVSSAFWFSDLSDRSFLEAYLPANFEYDQQKITMNVEFNGAMKQKIYTNGDLTKIDDTHFTLEFPETYTSSSIYFHTAPVGRYPERLFTYRSIDGRDLPVTVYADDFLRNVDAIKAKTIASLTSLEAQYGPFLHKSVTVFNAGSGGMEYCGATMTDSGALNHELTHSYFARGGFMPANGNSGWIDEAITSWSDEGANEVSTLGSLTSNMAGHSPYRRHTDTDAYSKGKKFMSYLHYKFKSKGGLKSFLNQLIHDDAFKPMTTEAFIGKMSNYYAEDVSEIFKRHVYSKSIVDSETNEGHTPHMKMTIEEMASFL